MNEVITIGVDLAKNVFQVHGVDAEGAVVVRRQLRRGQASAYGGPRRGIPKTSVYRTPGNEGR